MFELMADERPFCPAGICSQEFDLGGGGGGLFDFLSSNTATAPSEAPADSSALFDIPFEGAGSGANRLQTGNLTDQGGGGLGGLLGNFGNLLPSLLGGAGGLIGMFTGQGGATDKALKKQSQATGPLQAAGNEALEAYRTGKLTPPQQASVDQYRKAAMAKWRQYFANAGIPVSSSEADINNKVEMDTMAYANQLLQQDFNNAYQATGMSTNNLTNLARQQALEDAQQRNQWQEFMKQITKIGGDVFGGQGDNGMPPMPPGTIYD